MHCTGQTSTQARSFTSIQASVMMAIPATTHLSVSGRDARPGSRVGPSSQAAGLPHILTVTWTVVLSGCWRRGSRPRLRIETTRRMKPGGGVRMQILLGVLALIAVLVIVALALSLRIVQQYEEGVLFRLGRVVGQKKPGLVRIVPVIDVLRRVSPRAV